MGGQFVPESGGQYSPESTTVTNETYINAQSVCELIEKIAMKNKDKTVTLIMDNARYQYCDLVKGFAQKMNIRLVFLPSYSPNLNLIERFWKFVKKESLYSKYYETFASFKEAIQEVLYN
ncbi:MAG: IS630 family transposase, partial [Chitinophagaceae bacterium]